MNISNIKKTAVILLIISFLISILSPGIGVFAYDANSENIQGMRISQNDRDIDVVGPKRRPSQGAGMQKPELVIQDGHSGDVDSVSFSPDGKYMASGSDDNTIKLWSPRTGACLRTLKGHLKSVRSVSFSPDGKYLASGSHDYTIKIWSPRTGECLRTLKGHSGCIDSVSFSPDGKYMASGSRDNTVKIWSPRTGECLRTLKGHSSGVLSVSFSPDGTYLASGSNDETIKLWSSRTGKCLRTLKGHSYRVSSVSFSPDGKYLTSGGEDKTVKLWSPLTGECLRTLKGHSNAVWSVSFSPDGKYIVSGSWDGTIKLWSPRSGECLRTLKGHSNCVTSVSFSPDGKYLASGSDDDTVKIWSPLTGECLRTLKGHSNCVTSVSFSPDGEYMASGSWKKIKLWSPRTGECLRTLKGHSDLVDSVSFSPDGKYLASGSEDGTIKLWSPRTGACLRTLKGHLHRVFSVSFSPDSKYLASGGSDNPVMIWSPHTGECLETLWRHTNSVTSVSFSPDGKYLASGSVDNMVKLWSPRTRKCLRTLKGHLNTVESVSFSPDSKYLASGSLDKTIKLWSPRTRKCLRTLKGHSGYVLSVSFSPDGKYMASGSMDGTIKLWSPLTGECIRTLKGHSSSVSSVSFSPDGKYMASGSGDTTIRIWNPRTGKQLAAMIAFDDGNWVTYTPEGYFDCSEGGKKYIGWTVGMKHYPFEQFFDEFYTPGLVARVMKGEKIAKLHDLRQGFALPPEVSIVSPKTGQTIKSETVKVVVKATDIGGGINDIRLYHNGKQVDPGKDLKITGGKGKTRTARFTIQLLPGKNTLRTTAYNRDHTVESNPYQLTIQCDIAKKTARSFVLCVGISKYNDPQLDLHSARKDAEILASYLEKKGKKIFAGQYITVLCDEKATRSNIVKEMKVIRDKAREEDVVIIFFSGHGDIDPTDSQYYFIPYDFSKKGDIELIFKTYGLPASTIGSIARQTKARKMLLIFDTCHSERATVAFRGMSEIKAMKMLAKSFGIHILAASLEKQLAGEVYKLKHGILTYALIEGMDGKADSDRDGIVTVRELLPYVEQRVEALSLKYLGRKQYPVADSKGMDFPLVVK